MTKMFASRFAQLCFLSASPLALVVAAAPAAAQAQTRVFDIPAQPLSSAVLEFSRQADVMVVLPPELAAGRRSAAVKGSLSADAAIAQLLRRTGLRAMPNAAGGYRVAPFAEIRGTARAESSTASSGEDGRTDETEIIVTAQKREERLQDVPVPVSAIRAEALADNNLNRVQDYFSRIPGLTATPENHDGAPKLTIRGITTGGFANPTVGIVVDDVAYGASTNAGGGGVAPDIDPSDLARVEVLRGPQGTLYGASSMGGLLKFVTTDPNTSRFSGRVQAGISGVHNGNEAGYQFRGSLNIPLDEVAAVRVSAFARHEPGYIDDPTLGLRGVNEADAKGGRVSFLLRPSPDFSIRLGALYQEVDADGTSYIHRRPGLEGLEQSAVLGSGFSKRRFQVYDATIKAKLGGVDLTSITAYNFSKHFQSIDFSSVLGGFADALYGVNGAYFLDGFNTDKFSQEVRLEAPIGSSVDLLLGGYYTHEDTRYRWDLEATAPTVGTSVGSLGIFKNPTTYAEYAVFGDVTFHISERFDLQVGGRQSHNRQNYSSEGTGPAFGGSSVVPDTRTSANAFTYLVTPRFKITDDVMLYARLASGYRAGGPNIGIAFGSNIPTKYDPDRTNNYEVGLKGAFFNRRLNLDISAYYIEWKDLQIQIYEPGSGTSAYNTNAGRAKSQGVEFSASLAVTNNLDLSGWVVYSDAQLTEDFPPGPAFGVAGDRLPYSSRFSSHISLDQRFQLGDSIDGRVGLGFDYVGNRKGVFTATADREAFPGYGKLDVSAQFNYQDWSLNIFANNLTDKRGVLTGGLGTVFPYAYTYIQPRTIGASIVRKF